MQRAQRSHQSGAGPRAILVRQKNEWCFQLHGVGGNDIIDRMPTILIADDSENIRQSLARILEKQGYRLVFAETAAETRKQVAEHQPELVLLDLMFPDCNDLSLLRHLKTTAPELSIIMISANTEDLRPVVEAIHAGADDWIPKPIERQNLIVRVEKVLRDHIGKQAQQFYLRERQEAAGLNRLIGESESMKRVRETIRNLADNECSVLIQGESGTGKELAARALHNLSDRKNQPFIAINCAAIPEALFESELFGHEKGAFTGADKFRKGAFEEAAAGTIFLDEIGELPLSQQAKLLRVLESKKFSRVGGSEEQECKARIIAATNADLQDAIKTKKFRLDLFHRINVGKISMPALRDHVEDIAGIVEHCLLGLTAKMGRQKATVQSHVMKIFMEYDWPGNVRELQNALEGILACCGKGQTEITVRDLPVELQGLGGGGGASDTDLTELDRQEKRSILKALQQTCGNQTQAAKLIGMSRNTMTRRVKYYGIKQD